MTETAVMSLGEFLRELVVRLRTTRPGNQARLLRHLERLRDEVRMLSDRYAEPPPVGAESIQAVMLEALHQFDLSMESVAEYLDSGLAACLDEAHASAVDADDLLGTLEYLIQTNRDILNFMVDSL